MINKKILFLLFILLVFIGRIPVCADSIRGSTIISQALNSSVDMINDKRKTISEPSIPPLASLYSTSYQTFSTQDEWEGYSNASRTERYLHTFLDGSDNSTYIGAAVDKNISQIWNETLDKMTKAVKSKQVILDPKKGDSYKVTYTYKGEDGEIGTDDDVSQEITVTVKNPLSLEVPSSKDFGSYKLGSSNSRLSWKDEKDIKVEDSRNSPWVLKLKTDGSIQDYLELDGKVLTSEVIAFSDNKTNNDIAKSLSDPNKGLVVDYETIKKTREDSGTLTWILSPSEDMIKE